MADRFLRWLRGYVVFCISGKFPERFINICNQRGIRLFSIRPQRDVIYAAMLIPQYRSVRRVAKRAGVRLRITEKVGLPFIIHRNRGRYGLLIGLVIFLMISLLMQNFVWCIDINGISTLSESALRESLREAGLCEGVYAGTLSHTEIERRIMQEYEDIGWMSVNLIGSKAEVEIKEKVRKPDIISWKTPCNIKASHDGLIEKMVTTQGSAMIKEGSAVVKGQLLVSSVMVNALSEIDYVHAAAEVVAKTERKETFSVSKTGVYKKALETERRHNMIFCFYEFPLKLTSSPPLFTSRFETQKLTLGGNNVQFGVKTEVITPFEVTPYELTEKDAEAVLLAEESLYRFFSLGHCLSVKAVREFAEYEETFECKVSYTCREDIAKEEIFIVN